ncbi:alpha/beta fold hydrolase [Arcobacter sp. CECT 8985]|uniref:alpha/beta fold hydrolase n=1 Tax=Arcobacter sp. CECT 8985 TaxID=1935424 RepID=UPI00100AA0A8|nr:alpha/beta fold hydrolase [Arcobacter sp. CECT 8985]RXJ88173.1 glycerol acyltransferase [Arcobacter sp. CECT 8985]
MLKKDLLIDSSGYVLNLLEKILSTNIKIYGQENIPKDNPKIFVANHFTRIEALLVPYCLYDITNKKVGVIADDGLMKSYFGNYLQNIGALAKSHPNRNNIILSDLLTARKDWLIFPEGRMVKAKDITKEDNHYTVKINDNKTRIFTGSAFFALYSEILRQDYLNKKIKNKNKFQRKYLINQNDKIEDKETMIIPINITYSPIRTEENFLEKMVKRLYDDISDKFLEEIKIESNIVLNSQIIIRILKPISLHKMLKNSYGIELNHNTIVEKLRYELTHKFMKRIYENLTVRFEHIFVLILYYLKQPRISKLYFKRLIYLVAKRVKEDCTLFEDDIRKDIINLISYENYDTFDEIIKIAINDKIITQTKDEYIIHKDILLNMHTHNTIRIKNILRVVLNEVLIIDKMNEIVKQKVSLNNDEIDTELLHILQEEEIDEFETDYIKFSQKHDIKPKDIGKPFLLKYNNSKKCILIIHGFSSAPKEVEELAVFLNNQGFNVYAVRLKGHGTVPEDLKDTSYKDWYNSVSRSVTIASLKYDKIDIVGFSTGGLLALLSSRKYLPKLKSIVCINAALNLNDIRIKTVLPAIDFWNDIVSSFNANSLKKEFIENKARYPKINYDKFYVKAILQLKELMNITKLNLEKINKKILIIQAKNDPVVNISSAYEIHDKIKSQNKQLAIFELNEHVIIKGKNTKKVFDKIEQFLVNE